jgi:hypothetical protein
MGSSEQITRQLGVLTDLAVQAQHRADVPVPMPDGVEAQQFLQRFTEYSTTHRFIALGADYDLLASDLNALLRAEEIRVQVDGAPPRAASHAHKIKSPQIPFVIFLTDAGLHRIAEHEKTTKQTRGKWLKTIGWLLYAPAWAIFAVVFAPGFAERFTKWLNPPPPVVSQVVAAQPTPAPTPTPPPALTTPATTQTATAPTTNP